MIIPFRDRQSHLTRLLAFLIPILKRQRLDFRFIVTEQVGFYSIILFSAFYSSRGKPVSKVQIVIIGEFQYGSDLFNKGRIMNAAFNYAESLGVDCVIFHDVDMFPQV